MAHCSDFINYSTKGSREFDICIAIVDCITHSTSFSLSNKDLDILDHYQVTSSSFILKVTDKVTLTEYCIEYIITTKDVVSFNYQAPRTPPQSIPPQPPHTHCKEFEEFFNYNLYQRSVAGAILDHILTGNFEYLNDKKIKKIAHNRVGFVHELYEFEGRHGELLRITYDMVTGVIVSFSCVLYEAYTSTDDDSEVLKELEDDTILAPDCLKEQPQYDMDTVWNITKSICGGG